ncbi:MAG: hypothetical protein JWP07_3886 [Pseudonocardiales bacterium]|nr:hypothetical protein [Pseudonocardiales bacterium]
MPLVIWVVLDAALSTDARVVDEHVQAAELSGRVVDGGTHRGVVGDVPSDADQTGSRAFGKRHEIQNRYRGALGGKPACGGETDTGCAAGDEYSHAREPCHRTPARRFAAAARVVIPWSIRRACPTRVPAARTGTTRVPAELRR